MTRTDLAYRLSGYVTLGLAGVCLCYASGMFLSLLPYLGPPLFAGLLALAYLVERRGWVLPVWGANLLGALIALAAVVGVVLFLLGPAEELFPFLPVPAALLPYIGPFVMVLVLVKLVRPKQPGDLWSIQGLGLLLVILACVLTDRPLFGLLLLAYVVAGVWHLGLFYLQRERLRAEAPGTALPWRWLGIARAGLWATATALVALPLFVLTPRSGESSWNPLMLATGPITRPPRETGGSDEIDLNRTGTVEVNDDVAFRVEAFADASLSVPKTDLSPATRWRGVTLEHHTGGRWVTAQAQLAASPNMMGIAMPPGGPMPLPGAPAGGGAPSGPPPPAPPRPGVAVASAGQRMLNLGPGQFYLRFEFDPRRTGGQYLAEPVVVRRGFGPPWFVERPEGRGNSLFQPWQDTFLPLTYNGRGECRYRQLTVALEDPDLSLPVTLEDGYYRNMLVEKPPAPVTAWTTDLLRRLKDDPRYGLTAEDLEMVTDPEPPGPDALRGPPPPAGGRGGAGLGQGPPVALTRVAHVRSPEKVARALCAHLASSGEYSYSLELHRQDPTLDPTLDFLANVKTGHCERYATALALMLRSQGIPSRVVKGFRGADHLGDGRYEVRNSRAHSWVEVLLQRPTADGKEELRWLTLDPTPQGDPPPPSPLTLARLWERGQKAGSLFWKDFVLDFDPEAQQEVQGPLASTLRRGWTALRRSGPVVRAGLLLALLAPSVLGLWWIARRWPRRGRTRQAARVPRVGFYARLLQVLAKVHGLAPQPSQTPREFAATAGAALRAVAATVPLAEVPAELVTLYYRVCYGGQPLTPEEELEVSRRLEALARKPNLNLLAKA